MLFKPPQYKSFAILYSNGEFPIDIYNKMLDQMKIQFNTYIDGTIKMYSQNWMLEALQVFSTLTVENFYQIEPENLVGKAWEIKPKPGTELLGDFTTEEFVDMYKQWKVWVSQWQLLFPPHSLR